jgi:hypothetical protein
MSAKIRPFPPPAGLTRSLRFAGPWLGPLLLLAGCGIDEGVPVECFPGASRVCFAAPAGEVGPAELEGVGACRSGFSLCDQSGHWGSCEGAILPRSEVCDVESLDEDCDGEINELADADDPMGCACEAGTVTPCFDGAPEQENVGVCQGGLRACLFPGIAGACEGQVLPAPSDACDATLRDEDCDGSSNEDVAGEGCVCAPGAVVSCAHACAGATQTCSLDGRGYGPCLPPTGFPSPESCDVGLLDEDCDGQVNEEGDDCVCAPLMEEPCYDAGPPEVAGVGACQWGTRTCLDTGAELSGCVGQGPAPSCEDCAPGMDADCDGLGCVGEGRRAWSFDGPGDADQEVLDVALASDGTFIAVGVASGLVVEGQLIPLASPSDPFIVRLGGAQLWPTNQPFLGDGNVQKITSVVADAAGGAYVALQIAGTLAITPTSGSLAQVVSVDSQSTPTLDEDFVVVRLDAFGKALWATHLDVAAGGTPQAAPALAANDAGVWVVGAIAGATTVVAGVLGPAPSSISLGSPAGEDAFIISLDPADGTLKTKLTFGLANGDRAEDVSIAPAPDGSVWVTGTIDFSPGGAVTPDPTSPAIQLNAFGGPSEDAFVLKLDSGGNVLKAVTLGSLGTEPQRGKAIAAAENAVVVAGEFAGSVHLPQPVSAVGKYDVFVSWLDANTAATLKGTSLGRSDDDAVHAIAVDCAGNAVVAGHSTLNNQGDYLLAKVSGVDATLVWPNKYDGDIGDDRIWGVAALPLGGVVAAGAFGLGVTAFGPTVILTNDSNTIYKDGFVVEVSP